MASIPPAGPPTPPEPQRPAEVTPAREAAPQPAATTTPKMRKLPFPLQDGEKTILVSNKHWMYLWPNISLRLVFAFVPVMVVAWALSEAGGFHDTGARIFWILAAIWLAYWCVRVALLWYAYYNDLWVITNQRIVDSYRPNPFNHRLSTADLVNVQDMTVHRIGILRTILDYGDIVCQTAANNQDFRLVGIPNPRAVQVLVDRERDRERLRLT